MESSSISIEVKVMSCKDLKAFNLFQKLSVYAVVSIVKYDNTTKEKGRQKKKKKKKKKKQQEQRTPIDREGDGNPVWNHVMRFDFHLKEDRLLLDECSGVFIEFDLRCEAIVFGDKTIGEVRVPIKDLMQEEEETPSNGAVRFVSYQVRSPDGKPNGVLHLSYKIIIDNHNHKHNDDVKIYDNAASPLVYHPHGQHTSAGVGVGVEAKAEAYYPYVEVEPPSLSGVHYPSIELDPLPPLLIPPPPPPEQAYYSAPEFYYVVPPAAPPPPQTPLGPYYPPPPPHPPSPPLVYHAPPVPYGYGSGSYGYGWHDDHSAIQFQTTSTDQWGNYMR